MLLIQNIQRQETNSASTPPVIKPVAVPSEPTVAQTPSAVCRDRPWGKQSSSSASAAGAMTAAASPWPARPITRIRSDGAIAARAEVMANTAAPVAKTRRRPKRSAI